MIAFHPINSETMGFALYKMAAMFNGFKSGLDKCMGYEAVSDSWPQWKIRIISVSERVSLGVPSDADHEKSCLSNSIGI